MAERRSCQCGAKLAYTNRSGLCQTCTASRACAGCGGPISVKSTGHCRACANIVINASDNRRAATSAAMKRIMADPAVKAKRQIAWRAWHERAITDPAHREKLRQCGLIHGSRNISSTRTPEVRAKAGLAISATKLAHIPAACRTEYRALRKRGIPASDAARIVIDDYAVTERRAIAAVRQAFGKVA